MAVCPAHEQPEPTLTKIFLRPPISVETDSSICRWRNCLISLGAAIMRPGDMPCMARKKKARLCR